MVFNFAPTSCTWKFGHTEKLRISEIPKNSRNVLRTRSKTWFVGVLVHNQSDILRRVQRGRFNLPYVIRRRNNSFSSMSLAFCAEYCIFCSMVALERNGSFYGRRENMRKKPLAKLTKREKTVLHIKLVCFSDGGCQVSRAYFYYICGVLSVAWEIYMLKKRTVSITDDHKTNFNQSFTVNYVFNFLG